MNVLIEHDWLGMGMIALGCGLLVSGAIKRRAKRLAPPPAGAIRPEFAMMGDIVRPMINFFLAFFALKICLFYFVLGGDRFLTPLDFGGILFVVASYAAWLALATKRPAPAAVPEAPEPDLQAAPAASR
jgi:hypothetical protein